MWRETKILKTFKRLWYFFTIIIIKCKVPAHLTGRQTRANWGWERPEITERVKSALFLYFIRYNLRPRVLEGKEIWNLLKYWLNKCVGRFLLKLIFTSCDYIQCYWSEQVSLTPYTIPRISFITLCYIVTLCN